MISGPIYGCYKLNTSLVLLKFLKQIEAQLKDRGKEYHLLSRGLSFYTLSQQYYVTFKLSLQRKETGLLQIKVARQLRLFFWECCLYCTLHCLQDQDSHLNICNLHLYTMPSQNVAVTCTLSLGVTCPQAVVHINPLHP